MALSGNITLLEYSGSGKYQTVTINVPADAPSGSEFYEHRGQSVTQSTEIDIITSSSLPCYIKITSIQIWPPRIDSESTVYIEPTYRVYGSEASRSADVSNYLWVSSTSTEWDADVDTDPYQTSYNSIKAAYSDDSLSNV